MAQWDLNCIRIEKHNKSCVIFIHGFQGDSSGTWGDFPQLLSANPVMSRWDVLSFGYQSNLAPDLLGIWEGDPDIRTIGHSLGTFARTHVVGNYGALAIIAHSMGGLAVQRALLDDSDLRKIADKVILFGTPSFGLIKAWPFRLPILRQLNRQVSDMGKGSKFICSLREDWSTLFDTTPPFGFLAVAGDSDEFVTQSASISKFPDEQCEVVPGNHLEIVKPSKEDDASLCLAIDFICGTKSHKGQYDSSALALERRNFQQVIEQLEPNRDRLDRHALVDLALAMDALGKREDAINVLADAKRLGTDAMGVLAGRHKRNWIKERVEEEAQKALELYDEAYRIALTNDDAAQGYYHGINVAFLELIYEKNRSKAREIAREVLELCTRATDDELPQDRMWRLVTEAEAYLILGNIDTALERYRQALEGTPKPKPWQFLSTSRQAMLIVDNIGEEQDAERLVELFSGDHA